MRKLIFIVACLLLTIVSCTKEEEEYFPEEPKKELNFNWKAKFNSDSTVQYNTVKTR